MEPTISPTPIVASRSVNTPKDLTASLINSNLREMKLTSSAPKNVANAPLQKSTTANIPSFTANSFSQPSSFPMMNSLAFPPKTTASQMSSPPYATSFTPVANSGLSPAAFFKNSSANSSNLSLQPKQPPKQLTFSEINDFLN